MLRINVIKSFPTRLKPLVFTAISAFTVSITAQEYPALDPRQLDWLADQIYRNECNRNPACLTAWNAGENFPSLGIGHFIWYPSDHDDIYVESFPALMAFMANRGVSIPPWIQENDYDAPWPDRETFMAELDSERLQALRLFLLHHIPEQMDFILSRFDSALDDINRSILSDPELADSSAIQLERLHNNFYAVANASPPHGLYALVDYVNFKGTGTSPNEAYNGRGWGLKQVLLQMKDAEPPLKSFIESARSVLAQRVANAPADRDESRWLNGWHNRLATYHP